MKRNLVPFLGIAFVVAVAATGVFYGLFVGKIRGASPAAGGNPAGMVVMAHPIDKGLVLTAADVRLAPAGTERPEGAFGTVEEVVGRTVLKTMAVNDPVTAGGLSTVKESGGLRIPVGMRAISIRAADSSGLVPYLRPGNRVDVQSIHGQQGGEATVRTLLSNVEVLNVLAEPAGPAGTVLNVLVPARDVERVALADSAAKVRIVLRNGVDSEEAPVSRPPIASRAIAAAAGPRVSFHVRMAAAAAETVREIASRAGLANGGAAVSIGLLPADWKLEPGSLRVLSNESVESPQWQEVSLQAGGPARNDYDLRLRLTPCGEGKGTLRVRVRPELTIPQRGGLSSRRFSADLNVAAGQSVLVAGFERDSSAPALIEKLFRSPTPPAAGSELVLLVTPSFAPQPAAR